jgi:hypothetical protein
MDNSVLIVLEMLLSSSQVFVTYNFLTILKDEVLITVGCPIFPSISIAKYLFTGSLKNRSIDNLETQKKYISMKNSQFLNYLLYVK